MRSFTPAPRGRQHRNVSAGSTSLGKQQKSMVLVGFSLLHPRSRPALQIPAVPAVLVLAQLVVSELQFTLGNMAGAPTTRLHRSLQQSTEDATLSNYTLSLSGAAASGGSRRVPCLSQSPQAGSPLKGLPKKDLATGEAGAFSARPQPLLPEMLHPEMTSSKPVSEYGSQNSSSSESSGNPVSRDCTPCATSGITCRKTSQNTHQRPIHRL